MNKKYYHSFQELAEEKYGLKPFKKITKDKQKLEKQKEKFLGVCPYCGEVPKYIYGTNIIACQNEQCKGKKVVYKELDGTETVSYKPYIRMLSKNGSTIGTTLFDEGEGK